MKKVKTVLLIVGTISEGIKRKVKEIIIEYLVELLRKDCFLDTSSIVRNVLDN